MESNRGALLGTTVFCGKILWILRGISLNSMAHCGKSMLNPAVDSHLKDNKLHFLNIQYIVSANCLLKC